MGTGSGNGLSFGATAGALPLKIPAEPFSIGRTLSARALNYDVKDRNGNVYRFIEGTRITDTEVFAGKGVRKKLKPEVAAGLSREYGGKPRKWQHVKGIGYLDYNGRSRQAEIHWFEESSAGKVKFRVKRWLEP